MTEPVHATIARFQAAARLLDLEGSAAGANDAIGLLAAWMDLAADHLTEDDVAVLISIGGLLYRDGLHRRGP